MLFVLSDLDEFKDAGTLWAIYDFVMKFYAQAGFQSYRSVTKFVYLQSGPEFKAGIGFDDGFDRICLRMASLSSWCQVMYQVSHECAHQIMYRLSCADGLCEHRWVSWVEELLAECCAFAFLKYSCANWSKCRLSKSNFKYSFSIRKYLDDMLQSCSENGVLLACPNHKSLLYVDATFCDNRSLHGREVLDLLELFDRSYLRGAFAYTQYADFSARLLDVNAYLQAYPENKMVKYLCDLQRCICDGTNLKKLQMGRGGILQNVGDD